MTRVLCLGDSHYDLRSRWDECVRVHNWIADLAHERQVDLVAHAGDVFEKRSEPEERLEVAKWLARVAEQCPVLLVRGNHDVLGDLALFRELRTAHPVIVEERAGVHELAGLKVAALAWPRKGALEHMWRQAQGRGPTADELAGAAREALHMTISGMAASSPDLCIAHAMVRGSTTSTGQPLVGCDMEIGIEDLAAAGCPVVLGHIHKSQEWEAGTRVWYTGSPRRTAFGETETKSVLLMEFDDATGRLVGVERVATPCTPMVLLEGVMEDTVDEDGETVVRAMTIEDLPDLTGAEVRLRYLTTAEERRTARDQAEGWRATLLEQEGAKSVQVEERVIPTSTARAPEVATDTSLRAKLRRLWDVRKQAVADAVADRRFSLVDELQEEAP